MRQSRRSLNSGDSPLSGLQLIDGKLQPRQRRISTIQGASTLPHRVRELDPTRILIVKKTVFKPARQSLIEAGVGDRILNTKPLPVPSHGKQRKFRTRILPLVDKESI